MIHLSFRFRSAKNPQPTTVSSETSLIPVSAHKKNQQRINWALGLVCLGWSGFLIGCNNSSTVSTLGDWTVKSALDGVARSGASSFVINNIAYLGTGIDTRSQLLQDFWSYDPARNAWSQKANFGGVARNLGVGFSVGAKGYIGTGSDVNGDRLKDFWEYDVATNAWKKIADFAGSARTSAVAFSANNKGYVGTGNDGNYLKDFWAYNPATNSWAQTSGYGGAKREGAVAFVIDNKAYVGTGNSSGTTQRDWFMYDAAADTWTQKLDFTTDQSTIARSYGVAFAINGKGYITLGNGSNSQVVWQYDPATDTWATMGTFEGATRTFAVGFAIGNKGYVTTGSSGGARYDDLWDFDPTIEQSI
ncbi:Kelch repeat-containing protein [Spirosoma sp.]|uniref:Kelch repeat-containing protein n=1 Tax=Spirosoma sp. TaxID=1899569 RepID=UPI003B3A98B4